MLNNAKPAEKTTSFPGFSPFSALGSKRVREGERGREREGERAGQTRVSLFLALRVEYGEDPGYKVADTNCLRN